MPCQLPRLLIKKTEQFNILYVRLAFYVTYYPPLKVYGVKVYGVNRNKVEGYDLQTTR